MLDNHLNSFISFWVVLLILLSGLLGVFCKKVRNFKFRKRLDIKFEQIYAMYFAHVDLPKGLVEEIWVKVAQALEVSPKKLRATDRFDRELKTLCFVDSDEELYDLLLESNNNSFPKELSRIRTIGDFVTFTAELKSKLGLNPHRYPETDRDLPHPDESGIGSGDHSHDWGRPTDGGPPTKNDHGPPRLPQPGDPPAPRGPKVPPP